MPIKIPNRLPATATLTRENIFVMTETRAMTQDIRPLKILLLNLMPTKIETETQICRLISNTPLQVELELMRTRTHEARNASAEHMLAFYTTFDEVRERYFDGMIITGAPVERMAFEEVEYWAELCEVMDWSLAHVHSTFHICWGAQAALYHHFGIAKVDLPAKLSGVFEHEVVRRSSMLMRGFDDRFMVPHSRHTGLDEAAVWDCPALKVLAASEEAGLYAMATEGGRQVFVTGHSEYDPETLRNEYLRDLKVEPSVAVPANYFPGNDPAEPPLVTWRAHANLLYHNWMNYFVYQTTPYDVSEIAPVR